MAFRSASTATSDIEPTPFSNKGLTAAAEFRGGGPGEDQRRVAWRGVWHLSDSTISWSCWLAENLCLNPSRLARFSYIESSHTLITNRRQSQSLRFLNVTRPLLILRYLMVNRHVERVYVGRSELPGRDFAFEEQVDLGECPSGRFGDAEVCIDHASEASDHQDQPW